MRAAFLRNPVIFTAKLTGYFLWYVIFLVLTVIFGGLLLIAGKGDVWVNWWLPW